MADATKIHRFDLEPDVAPMEHHPHKPELGVYIDIEDEQMCVVLQIGALWGQHMRWAQMTAEQALELANMLNYHAEQIHRDELAVLIESPVREEA